MLDTASNGSLAKNTKPICSTYNTGIHFKKTKKPEAVSLYLCHRAPYQSDLENVASQQRDLRSLRLLY